MRDPQLGQIDDLTIGIVALSPFCAMNSFFLLVHRVLLLRFVSAPEAVIHTQVRRTEFEQDLVFLAEPFFSEERSFTFIHLLLHTLFHLSYLPTH